MTDNFAHGSRHIDFSKYLNHCNYVDNNHCSLFLCMAWSGPQGWCRHVTIKNKKAMSLLNFLSGFAVFNVVCDMFSNKRKPVLPTPEPHYRHCDYEDYPEYKTDIASDSDIEDLQDRIDELENILADCDIMSEHYDDIQDRIDELQDRLDKMETNRDLYMDHQDDLDYLQDELDELEDW